MISWLQINVLFPKELYEMSVIKNWAVHKHCRSGEEIIWSVQLNYGIVIMWDVLYDNVEDYPRLWNLLPQIGGCVL